MSRTESRQRGAHLLDAVHAVVAEEGFGALSMRSVAKKAGVSLAQVQYYFHTRSELVDAAFQHAADQFLATLSTLDSAELSLERLRDMVWLWLPLDEHRDRRARVWLAYAAAAATEARLARETARLDADLRGWLAEQLRSLQRVGQLVADLDCTTAAAQLLIMIDGLTVQTLVIPIEQRLTLATVTIGSWFTQLAPKADQ